MEKLSLKIGNQLNTFSHFVSIIPLLSTGFQLGKDGPILIGEDAKVDVV